MSESDAMFHLPDPATWDTSHVIKYVDAPEEGPLLQERALYRSKLVILSHRDTGEAFMRNENVYRHEVWGWSDVDHDHVRMLTEEERRELDRKAGKWDVARDR